MLVLNCRSANRKKFWKLGNPQSYALEKNLTRYRNKSVDLELFFVFCSRNFITAYRNGSNKQYFRLKCSCDKILIYTGTRNKANSFCKCTFSVSHIMCQSANCLLQSFRKISEAKRVCRYVCSRKKTFH